MPPTYKQNKIHIYRWRENNPKERKLIALRFYYKKKIDCPIWRQIKYEFLDILRP